jgi:hypothetical protein
MSGAVPDHWDESNDTKEQVTAATYNRGKYAKKSECGMHSDFLCAWQRTVLTGESPEYTAGGGSI